ncbi:O-methyltransferase-domain-containing protein [Mycena vitilis]|nr:O-methyltransferase-domain-containing protein [Mycena vitilis]
MALARKYSHLQIIIQDMAQVTAQGAKVWNTEFPEGLRSNQVKLAAHDFFGLQPVRDASVFLLRYVLHDWPDAYACKILTHLRHAATPETTLVILDHVIPYGCSSVSRNGAASRGILFSRRPHLMRYS